MKKLFLAAGVLTVLVSCTNEESSTKNEQISSTDKRNCASYEVLQEQLKANPNLAVTMNEIESFTERAIKEGRLVNGKIEIPVVVNVLYRTAAQNISLAQIQSQITALNQDFNATNSDFNQVPALFSGVKANVGISFVLQGVVRKSTNTTSWSTNDAMKKAPKGIPPTTPSTVLNLWCCNMGGGILGYAQFPGGPSSTDGVVIDDNAFGTTGTAAYPFNLGRTATHEVGHWLNLRHIWGDATCGNDFVADTPLHNAPNYGAPSSPHYSTCTGTPVEMTMNYMDYTDDRAMYMFSEAQKQRMLTVFAAGGPRNSFAQP
ncbi:MULTISPECIES: zinc metalloprotease [Flavobacterium]|uniref:zinc metalloprotease n=1 Tax=Flavobacterium TaxID=237 RepID=UPI001FCA4F68|nr:MULTISPECIES: zinc metalloprotease [Flavobacterium]UOK41652.1 zinc metalloprotease [Flavobacterium enshiense]